MALPQLTLTEPLVNALVTLLEANLPAVIDLMNTPPPSDGILVDHPAQYLDFIPVASTLEGGLPAVGVQRITTDFEDDLQFSVAAHHRYAITAIVQNADHRSLVKQLERTVSCVAYCVEQDRLAGTPPGTNSVVKKQGGAWSVQFVGAEPGPLLGDQNPTDPEAPPRSYVSWSSLILESKTTEV